MLRLVRPGRTAHGRSRSIAASTKSSTGLAVRKLRPSPRSSSSRASARPRRFARIGRLPRPWLCAPVRGAREVLRAGALEAEDRLLVIAHHEQRAQLAVALAFARRRIRRSAHRRCSTALHWCPALRRPGCGRSAGRACSGSIRTGLSGSSRVGGAADQVVEIDQPFARLGRLPTRARIRGRASARA